MHSSQRCILHHDAFFTTMNFSSRCIPQHDAFHTTMHSSPRGIFHHDTFHPIMHQKLRLLLKIFYLLNLQRFIIRYLSTHTRQTYHCSKLGIVAALCLTDSSQSAITIRVIYIIVINVVSYSILIILISNPHVPPCRSGALFTFIIRSLSAGHWMLVTT